MFEISISEIKKCISQLQAQCKELSGLQGQLESVEEQLCQLENIWSDSLLLKKLADDIESQRQGYNSMVSSLTMIVDYYEKTEKKLTEAVCFRRNQFAKINFTQLKRMLEALNIEFIN